VKLISSENQPIPEPHFPAKIVGSIIVICLLPVFLNQFGIDFGSQSLKFYPSLHKTGTGTLNDAIHKSLSGSFTHTILEWSAFCTAIFIVILSFVHFNIRKDVTTPIIGVALLFSGCMDAFHALAADRLIEAVADNQNLIPFTWAICRVFNVLIMISCVMTLLLTRKQDLEKGHAGLIFVIATSLIFGVVAFGIISYCAMSSQLPQTMFPDSLITRPWDIGPLVLYIFAGLFVFPRLFMMERSFITSALVISVIPHIATQAYMAFGSKALFDNNFNVAHFLKIIGYFIPFLGLSLEYIKTYRQEELTVKTLKSTQEELNKSSYILQATLDSAADAIITVDEKGIIQSANLAVERMFQYPPSSLVNQNVKILMPEPYRSEHDQYIKNYLESGVSKIIGMDRELVGLRKDGNTFPLDLAISEMFLGETRMFTGIVRDITQRKEAEEKLATANRKTQLILNSAGEGIYGLDLDGNTTFVNSAAERILGFKEEDLLGKFHHALVHHSKPDGTPYPQKDCHIFCSLRDGKMRRESEEVFWRKEGTPVPVEYVSTPIKENGKLVGAVVTFKDISERKRIERMIHAHTKDLKRANEMLYRSNKELDDFAYIVSHDLKEPLRGIYNYSSFIKEDYFDKLDEDGISKLDTLERLSKRMESLINTILYYARLGRSESTMAPVDLNKVLENTLENMQSLLTESNAEVRMPRDFPTVYGNETRLGEVFQNLIANAIKYNDKPEKWVEIGYTSNDNESVENNGRVIGSEHSSGDPSSSPVFYVKDNGIGILEKHFDSLFRIFKRLNGKNKFSDGAGAGTTIIKKIIEQHNGRIWLESKVDEGTTFYFTIGGKNANEKYQLHSHDSYS
jgi:PAS domain S-box-containing protein